MIRAWIIGICLILTITGCTKKAEPELDPEVLEVVVEELEEEVVVIENLDEEIYKKVRYRVQDELMVFDASRMDDGLMAAVRDDVRSGMDKEFAKEIIEEILDGYMNLWKQEIVTETLEFHVGEYSRSDFEKLMQNTSNSQIKGMVVAYVMEKLKQEGYQFE